MQNKQTLPVIIDQLAILSKKIVPKSFLFDFLSCFGIPQATITRLKSGDVNCTKKEGCFLLKGKIYFEPLYPDLIKAPSVREAIECAKRETSISRQKPRFLLATDFTSLGAFDTKNNEYEEFPITEIHDHYDFFMPLAGMEKAVFAAESEADVRAAENMAKLYDLILQDNPAKTREERHTLNIFLTRLLFCYFAEDTGIFPEKSFTTAIESYTQTDGSDLSDFLQELFLILNTGEEERGRIVRHFRDFPYVNGGLFQDTPSKKSTIPKFHSRSRQKLIELGNKSWNEINPDIFGSMFQGVVDEEKRGELGMHYTSVPNIMKVIKPLFLDDLYEELTKANGNEEKLKLLLSRIYRLRIFDPACGSGNFLIIAYKELRRLEMAIFRALDQIGNKSLTKASQQSFKISGISPEFEQSSLPLLQSTLHMPGIHVSQFYGIEIDDFAHEVAILALWLAEHQMNIEFKSSFGHAPASLPLKEGAKIVCGDATFLEWENVCPMESDYENYIIGNPPYLGARNQDDKSKEAVYRCYNGSPDHKDADLISCWFIKGAAYIRRGKVVRLAFVTTNSVCQGDHVAILWPQVLGKDLEIYFAHTSFKWSNSAKNNAGVTCVIVGLRVKLNSPKWIFSGEVKLLASNINPYLTKGSNTVIGRRDEPLCKQFPSCVMGSMARDGGNLILNKIERDQLLADYPQIKPLVRYLIGSQEFVRSEQRWCLWIEDRYLDLAKNVPPIAQRIAKVYNFRVNSTAKTTNNYATIPHQFAQRAHKVGSSIIIPRVTSERRHYIPFGYLNSEVVVSDSASVIYNAEPWIFSVISSKMHMVWVRTIAGRLEERIRYSSSICYNNFPFPEISPTICKDLDRHTENVLSARAQYPEKTIAWMYDPDTMPSALLAAHQALDRAVEKCYRDRPFTTDEERLEHLFSLYEQMTANENADLLTPKPDPSSPRSRKSRSQPK